MMRHLLLGDQFIYRNLVNFKLLKEPQLTSLETKESKYSYLYCNYNHFLICIDMHYVIFRVSAGIFVDLEVSPVPYLKLVRNVQCFIIHGNSDLIPNEWKNVSVVDFSYSS